MIELRCEIHGGPLRYHKGLWVCPGWDGEGCLNIAGGLPQDAYDRVSSGQTRWPGAMLASSS